MGEFVGGLMQGMAKGKQQQTEDAYKKAVMGKMKNEMELEQIKANAIKAWQADPTNISLAMMAGYKPEDILMMQAMGGMGGQRPTPAPSFETNGVPFPTKAQQDVTFPASMTVSGMDTGNPLGGPIDIGKILRHKLYGETNANPNDVTGTVNRLDENGIPLQGLRTRGGTVTGLQPAPIDYVEWVNGVDAQGNPVKIPMNKFTQKQVAGVAPMRQPVEMRFQNTTGPTGAESVTPMNPYTGQPQGADPSGPIQLNIDPSTLTAKDVDTLAANLKGRIGLGKGGFQTKPGPGDLPIPSDDTPTWVKKDDLSTLNESMTPNQARAAGYVRISTGDKTSIAASRQAKGVLADIAPLMASAYGPPEMAKEATGAWNRMSGGAKRYYQQLTQSNPDVAQLNRLTQGTLAPIVRQMGEKGNLSDTDIKRAGQLFAGTWDTPAVAWQSYQELSQIVNRGINNSLGLPDQKPAAKTNKVGLGLSASHKQRTGTTSSGGKWTIQPVR